MDCWVVSFYNHTPYPDDDLTLCWNMRCRTTRLDWMLEEVWKQRNYYKHIRITYGRE